MHCHVTAAPCPGAPDAVPAQPRVFHTEAASFHLHPYALQHAIATPHLPQDVTRQRDQKQRQAGAQAPQPANVRFWRHCPAGNVECVVGAVGGGALTPDGHVP